MNHQQSKVTVYSTTDYKAFRKVKGNRELNQTKIKRIIREINHGNDILDEVPILVTESGNVLEIIDGQHRLEIAKHLKRPVHYILQKKLTLHQVAKINSNVEKWKAKDFINCYIAAGNKNYDKLQEFMDKYQIPLSVSLVLLYNGIIENESGKETLREAFEKGSYEVKHWRQAVDIAEACMKFNLHNGWNSRAFVVAICRLLQKDVCDIDELVEKFKKDPKKLERHANYKLYLSNLENIYNINKQKRLTIY